MQSGNKNDIISGVQNILDKISLKKFLCEIRKNTEQSAINKPVDLQIKLLSNNRVLIVIEVANVNSTQLINEAVRLFYDSCPIKILILGGRNVPDNGKELCEKLLKRLYGQDEIVHTPARVFKYDEDQLIEDTLKKFLILD